jgi:N-acetylmuramoyl-L-alanine amidase
MKKILVSAGHSTVPPKDPGAVGNGYVEAQEALRLRDAVAAVLRTKGFTVLEDGSDGVSDPLNKAIALARTAGVAVEFHFNAGPAAATGIEVLSKPNLKSLAKAIAGGINSATGLVLRGESGWKADSSGQHHRLGFCEAGGAIVEVAFISNPNDMKKFSDNFTAIVTNVANAIADAAA